MKHVNDFEGIHAGKLAVVMGGGPSLPDNLESIGIRLYRPFEPPDFSKLPIFISVNFHSLALGFYADYMVFGDKLAKVPVMIPFVEAFQGVRVSQFREQSDVYLDPDFSWLAGGNSGALATWWALWLGCDPVLLAGMDCYQGPVKYCHEIPVPDHPCRTYPLENHLAAWRRVLKYCPGAERVRAISGPTAQVFGQWEELVKPCI